MSDNEGTVFGPTFFPGQKDEAGAPSVCLKCKGVDTVHLFINTETDEVTVECEECEEQYDTEQAAGLILLLGAMVGEENADCD